VTEAAKMILPMNLVYGKAIVMQTLLCQQPSTKATALPQNGAFTLPYGAP
jgi:hypothetical protein